MSWQTAGLRRASRRVFEIVLGIAVMALLMPVAHAEDLLRFQRSLLPRLLDQIAYSIPDGVALKSIRQSGSRVRVVGYAASSARASAFVRGLERSDLPLSVELTDIKEARVAGARVSEFALDLTPQSGRSAMAGAAACESLPPPLDTASDIDGALVALQMAGLGNSLEFDLFRPGRETSGQAYTGLPTAIRVAGNFDDIRRFAHDVNRLPALAVVSDFSIQETRGDVLRMDATVTVYRTSAGRGGVVTAAAQRDRSACAGGPVKAKFLSDPFSRAGL